MNKVTLGKWSTKWRQTSSSVLSIPYLSGVVLAHSVCHLMYSSQALGSRSNYEPIFQVGKLMHERRGRSLLTTQLERGSALTCRERRRSGPGPRPYLDWCVLAAPRLSRSQPFFAPPPLPPSPRHPPPRRRPCTESSRGKPRQFLQAGSHVLWDYSSTPAICLSGDLIPL